MICGKVLFQDSELWSTYLKLYLTSVLSVRKFNFKKVNRFSVWSYFLPYTMNICHVYVIPQSLIFMRQKMHTQFETEIIKIWMQVKNVKGCNSFGIEKADGVIKWMSLFQRSAQGLTGEPNPPQRSGRTLTVRPQRTSRNKKGD